MNGKSREQKPEMAFLVYFETWKLFYTLSRYLSGSHPHFQSLGLALNSGGMCIASKRFCIILTGGFKGCLILSLKKTKMALNREFYQNHVPFDLNRKDLFTFSPTHTEQLFNIDSWSNAPFESWLMFWNGIQHSIYCFR